jgi:hypothetical protein
MPVEIRCYNSDNSDSADFRLENSFEGQEYFVDPGFRVSSIKIDPDLWLISKTGTITSIPWVDSQDEIFIYPNPVLNKLNFILPSGNLISEIEILSVSGKKVAVFPGNKLSLDLSELPQGSYLVVFKSSTTSTARRFIKI